MKLKITVVTVVLIFLASLFAAYDRGVTFGRELTFRQVRTETIGDIQTAKAGNNIQLLEYLKARYYYFSNRAGITLRPGEGDYGPVDEKALEGYSAGKEAWFSDEYNRYKQLPGLKQK